MPNVRHGRPLTLLSIGALVCIFSLAVPASADWLRTQEGALIETRGPWKVKGALVVFTSKNGTLSSMRLSEVDLDASAVATIEAKSNEGKKSPGTKDLDPSSEPVVPPTGEPVLIVTDKDIPRARSTTTVDPEGAASPTPEGTGDGGASSLVTVSSWREVDPGEIDGVEIRGTVKNGAPQLVTNLRVLVRLENADGEILGVSNGFLGALSLVPGATTQFRAIFPDVSAVSLEPKFQVFSEQVEIQGVGGPQQPKGQES